MENAWMLRNTYLVYLANSVTKNKYTSYFNLYFNKRLCFRYTLYSPKHTVFNIKQLHQRTTWTKIYICNIIPPIIEFQLHSWFRFSKTKFSKFEPSVHVLIQTCLVECDGETQVICWLWKLRSSSTWNRAVC